MIPGPLCTCGEPEWVNRLLVDNEVIEEHRINIETHTNEQARELGEAQVRRIEELEQHGPVEWETRMLCPKCGSGIVITAEGMFAYMQHDD